MKKIFFLFLLISGIVNAQTPDATIKNNTNTWIRSAPLITGANEATLFDQFANSKLSRLERYTASGTNTYAVTISWVSAYQTNLLVLINFTNQNSGASTLNINGLGAKPIKKSGSSALIGGELMGPAWLSYDGTNFQLASGTSGAVSWGTITGTLSDQTDLQTALNAKQATLISGTNIKTVNSTSLLGSGNISIPSTFVALTDGPGSFSGKSLNYSRVNIGETALEYRTPAQVLSDIGGQSALTFSNGLTNTSGSVKFGGSITQHTLLDGAFHLYLGSTTALNEFQVYAGTLSSTHTLLYTRASQILLNAYQSASLLGGNISVSGSGGSTITAYASGTGAVLYDLTLNSSNSIFTDLGSSKKGLQYAATGYVTQTHSLGDKEYIDSHLSGLTFTNAPSSGNVPQYNGTNLTWTSISSSLAGQSDVNISSPSDAQLLQYRSSDSKWHNFSLGGDVTVDNTGVSAIGANKVINSMLAGSIAASKLIGTDIATVGTITSGTWNGSVIGSSYGGAGNVNGILKANGSGIVSLAVSNTDYLAVNNPAYTSTLSLGTLSYSDTDIGASFQKSVNSYFQTIWQNTNSGSTASTDLIISSDNGTATTHYLNAGKNSSGFTGSGSLNAAGYSYLTSTSDDLVIGTTTNNGIHWVVNNSITDAMSISGAGLFTLTPINASVINGAWTATSNNQYHFGFTGTFTTENVNSDNMVAYQFTPTLIRNAGNPTSQTTTAVLINPTFSNSPTTQYILRLQNASSDRFRFTGSGGLIVNNDNTTAGIIIHSPNAIPYAMQIFNDTYSTSSSIFSFYPGNGGDFTMGTDQAKPLSLYANGYSNTAFKIHSSGNIVISTPSVSGGLSVERAKLYIAQNNLSSSWLPTLRIDAGNHTGMTSTTEFINNDFSSATWAWVDGTTVTQRFNYFRAFTVNKTTTSAIFNDIYNVYIDQSIAGSGVTFTNNWALGLNGHLKMLDGSNIAFGTTTGTLLGTTTTQKLGHYGITPIVQPANTVAIDDVLINTGLRASGGSANFTLKVTHSNPENLKNYTVATLPAGTRGDVAYVTDALTPSFLVVVVGGGSTVTPVFYDGTNWVVF